MVDGKHPELNIDGTWTRICGHWFWDNDNGATLFCKELDPIKFVSGRVKKTNMELPSDAIQIGKCKSSDTLLSCSGGCNDNVVGYGCANCKAGEKATIEVECVEGATNTTTTTTTTNPPVDCQWSNWSILQECSRTCGGGLSRSKTLDSGPDIRLKNNQN